MIIEAEFPNLSATGWRETSQETDAYNCLGWAAGQNDVWWDIAEGYYWPDGVERNDAIGTVVSAYESIGYLPCESRDLEPGFDKIALYGKRSSFEHAARQLEDGKWTSKLGPFQDIEHNTLEGLSGEDYGEVLQILKRPQDRVVTPDSSQPCSTSVSALPVER